MTASLGLQTGVVLPQNSRARCSCLVSTNSRSGSAAENRSTTGTSSRPSLPRRAGEVAGSSGTAAEAEALSAGLYCKTHAVIAAAGRRRQAQHDCVVVKAGPDQEQPSEVLVMSIQKCCMLKQ